MSSKKEQMDFDESQMFSQIRELCVLCAKGIVKIADDNHYPPHLVAKFFVEVFQEILRKMEDN